MTLRPYSGVASLLRASPRQVDCVFSTTDFEIIDVLIRSIGLCRLRKFSLRLCGQFSGAIPLRLRRWRVVFLVRSLRLVLHFTAHQSHLDLQFANLFGLYAERVFGQDRDIGEFADF